MTLNGPSGYDSQVSEDQLEVFPVTLFGDEPKFASPVEALRAFGRAHESLNASWIFALSRRNKKDLLVLDDAMLYVYQVVHRMEDDLASNVANQNELMASMATVRDRNRRLEEKLREAGKDYGEINRSVADTDAEWRRSLEEYAKVLHLIIKNDEHSSLSLDNLYLMGASGNKTVAAVAQVVWNTIQNQIQSEMDQESVEAPPEPVVLDRRGR